jgi:hypothetical protein
MKKRYLVLAIFILFLCAFLNDTSYSWMVDKFCGEPVGVQKKFIDSLNRKHRMVLIAKQVPCYPGYLEVRCKTDVSEFVLNDIDSTAKNLHWVEVLIYDTRDILIKGDTGSM